MTNKIQYGVISLYPSTSGGATAKSLEGMVIGDGFHHRHTEYFTMEGVHRGWIRNYVKGVESGGLGNFGPHYGLVKVPGRGSGGLRPPEAEAKCEKKYFFLCKHMHSLKKSEY